MDINGRTVIGRAGIADLTGAALSTVDKWYRNRQRYRFPSRADGVHGAWWYLDDIEKFWDHYQQTHRATVDRVDRTGDPNELINAPQAARILGYNTTADLPPALLTHAANGDGTPSGSGQTTTSAAAAPEDPQALKDHAEPSTITATRTNSSTPPKQPASSDTPTANTSPPTYSTTPTTPNTCPTDANTAHGDAKHSGTGKTKNTIEATVKNWNQPLNPC
jgi:hypothetical protein